MDILRFEWDELKNSLNKKKHGVSFEEARTVFLDDNAILYNDPAHSDTEDRFIILGMSREASILVVCHCMRKNDTIIRIISARKADELETNNYYIKKEL